MEKKANDKVVGRKGFVPLYPFGVTMLKIIFAPVAIITLIVLFGITVFFLVTFAPFIVIILALILATIVGFGHVFAETVAPFVIIVLAVISSVMIVANLRNILGSIVNCLWGFKHSLGSQDAGNKAHKDHPVLPVA
jgi:hypothetical protein